MRFLKKYYPLILILLCVTLFFFPVIFLGKTFYFRDFHRFFAPPKLFMINALKSGALPFWCPDMFCGAPFASFVLNAVFYPFSVIYVLFPFPLSMNVFVIVHLLIGFGFFYRFIIALGLSREAAVLAGISYCFGSYAISAINVFNHLPTLVWMPAVLWGFHQALSRQSVGHYLATLLFLTLALLAGAPQLVLITIALMGVVALTVSPSMASGVLAKVRCLGVIPILVGAAVLIALVQLGPMYLDFKESIRPSGVSYAEATRNSLHPATLKHMLVPLVFPADFAINPRTLIDLFPTRTEIPWLMTIYPGVLILPLAVLGIAVAPSRQKMAWLAVFGAGMLLALGEHAPVYRLFYAVMPSFRFPEKFVAMAAMGLLVLAAHGVDALLGMCRRQGLSAGRLAAILMAVLVVDLYAAHRHLNPVIASSFYQFRSPEMAAIVEDTGHHRIFYDPAIAPPAGAANTIRNTHIQWQAHAAPNIGMLLGQSHVGGASGMELKYQYLLTELLLKPWPEKIDFLRMANVKYIVSTTSLADLPELTGRVDRVNALVYRIVDPLPRAWMVGNLQPVHLPVLEGLAAPAFDIKTSALAWGNVVGTFNSPGYQPIEDIDYSTANAIAISVEAENPGVLVVTESSYPGWRVWVDGQEKQILRVNYLFQGVALEKGSHQVVFRYRPPNFMIFAGVSAAGLFLFILAGCGWVAQRYHNGGGDSV